MNTFSSDTALPSGQMGRLEHLGLDGAATENASDARVRRPAWSSFPAFVGGKKCDNAMED